MWRGFVFALVALLAAGCSLLFDPDAAGSQGDGGGVDSDAAPLFDAMPLECETSGPVELALVGQGSPLAPALTVRDDGEELGLVWFDDVARHVLFAKLGAIPLGVRMDPISLDSAPARTDGHDVAFERLGGGAGFSFAVDVGGSIEVSRQPDSAAVGAPQLLPDSDNDAEPVLSSSGERCGLLTRVGGGLDYVHFDNVVVAAERVPVTDTLGVGADLAYSRDSDEFGVAWHDGAGIQFDTTPSDGSGFADPFSQTVASSAFDLAPSVAPTPDGFAVAWVESLDSDQSFVTQLTAAGPGTTANATPIAESFVNPNSIAIASAGNAIGLTWRQGNLVFVAVAEVSGTAFKPIGTTMVTQEADVGSEPAIVGVSNGFTVSWVDRRTGGPALFGQNFACEQ